MNSILSTTRLFLLSSVLVAMTEVPGLYANKAHDMLLGLSEEKRQAVFSNFMAGYPDGCGAVTATFFQGKDASDNAYWNVLCSNGKSYQVQLDGDARGSTNILSCDLLRRVKVECFKKF